MPADSPGHALWQKPHPGRATPAASALAAEGAEGARQGEEQAGATREEDDGGYQEECEAGQHGALRKVDPETAHIQESRMPRIGGGHLAWRARGFALGSSPTMKMLTRTLCPIDHPLSCAHFQSLTPSFPLALFPAHRTRARSWPRTSCGHEGTCRNSRRCGCSFRQCRSVCRRSEATSRWRPP